MRPTHYDNNPQPTHKSRIYVIFTHVSRSNYTAFTLHTSKYEDRLWLVLPHRNIMVTSGLNLSDIFIFYDLDFGSSYYGHGLTYCGLKSHCGLKTPYGIIDLGQLLLRYNDLLPHGTKPLSEPMANYHQMCSVAFTGEQFHKKCTWSQSVTCVRRLQFYCHVFQGPIT